MNSQSVMIQKYLSTNGWYFPEVLFITLYKVVLALETVDETLNY